MNAPTQGRARRIGGWGFAGESLTPPAAMVSWLDEHLGRGTPQPAFDPASAAALPEPRPPAALPGFSFDRLDRLVHARGQGLPDLVRLRTGTVGAHPDAHRAALRHLGRRGVADLVERCCRHARQFADRLRAGDRIQVLNEVVLNQVLVRFSPPGKAGGGDAAASDEFTREVIRRVQLDGTCWLSGTTWQGRAAMRISVSNWSTTEADVERSVAAILRAAEVEG